MTNVCQFRTRSIWHGACPFALTKGRATGQERYAMNEYLNSNSSRQSEVRSTNHDHAYAADQHNRDTTPLTAGQARKCGLDTGARGWRYVYQTH